MGLNYKMTAYKDVSYHELDRFINEALPIFGGKYEVVAYEEWSNDSCYIINVNGKISEYELAGLNEMFATGNPKPYHTSTILNHLCQCGAIEKGAYLIQVSW